jgi:hypothetical protein
MIAAVLDRITPGVRDALAGWGAASAFVALALRVALPPRDPSSAVSAPPRAETPRAVAPRELLVPSALGALAWCITIWPWFGRGIPAFAHDWKWPLLRAQLDAWPSMLHSLWLPWGAGAPAVQELAQYPIVIAAWIFGHALSPAWTLYLILGLLFIAGATGAAACAHAFDLDVRWQRLIAFVYPLAPAVTNRLSAGHLPWLLGYAIVPWIVYIAVAREPSRGRAGALGMLWGCAAAQVQFLIIAPLALFVAGKRALSRDIALAAIIACALQAPMIAALVWGHPGAAYASAHANGDWQLAQSARASLALAGAADPAGYFERFEANAELFLAPLLALAFLAAWYMPRAAPLGLLWLGSALWSAGLRGPLAAPLAYAFDHSLVSSAFREFSHTEVLATLPLLLLAALGARMLAARRGAIALGVLAFACFPAVWPSIAGDAARFDVAVQPEPAYASLADSIAALPGNGSVLWLPSTQPMRMSDARGGADSLALPIGAHPPFVEYRPSVPLVVAIRAIDEGDRAACGLLADLGVQAVVDRTDVTSVPGQDKRDSLAPGNLDRVGLHLIERDSAASLYGVPCYKGRITWASASVVRGDWLALRSLARVGATDEITLPPRPPARLAAWPPPEPTYESVDVARGWVPLSQADAFVRRFAGAFDDVVVTSRVDAPMEGSAELASTGAGSYSWRTQAQVRALLRVQPVAIWMSGVSDTSRSPNSSLEQSVASLPAASSNAAAPPRSHSLDEYAQLLGFVGPAPPQGSLIVMHQHSSGGWRAFEDGVPLATFPADGFAVGWRVDHPGILSIRYESPPMRLLWAIVGCAFAAAAAMAWPFAKRQI